MSDAEFAAATAWYTAAERDDLRARLAGKAFTPAGDPVPEIGRRVMHNVDYDLGTVVDRHDSGNGWDVWVRWDSDPSWPYCAAPDELIEPPAETVDASADAL